MNPNALQFQQPTLPAAAPFHAGAAPALSTAPVSFWEWFCRKFPPDEFVYNWQAVFVRITAAIGVASNSQPLNVQIPLFVFTWRSFGWQTVTGAAPTFPYGIGLAMQSGNNWTSGNFAAQTMTGQGQPYDFTFPWPREVPASTQLTQTVDNSLNAVGLTVDGGIWGLEPRRRTEQNQAFR